MRFFCEFVILVLLVLMSVAFFTLLDRKVLGYGQMRKGPFKVFLVGMIQPILDGLKLFFKNGFHMVSMGVLEVTVGSGVVFSCMLVSWAVFGSMVGFVDSISYMLILMLVPGISVVAVFIVGLFSSSVYSVLGVLRSVAQMVSYEVVLGLIFIFIFMNVWGGFVDMQLGLSLKIVMVFLLLLVVVMEVNRTPVDFMEGESELVSGGVTEMGGLVFAFMFMAEYGFMGFYSVLVSILVFGSVQFWVVFLVVYLFSWLRLSLPRFRYDLLMLVSWKVLMPLLMMLVVWVWCFV